MLPTRPFLAASPATPRTSTKRPWSNNDTSSSPSPFNSSSSPRQSTPSSSPPQSSQPSILETKDRSKRLRLDDTVIVGAQEEVSGVGEQAENAEDGAGDEETLLDYILSRLEPIPRLQNVSELLQEAMDTISNDSRSQEDRVKCLEEELRKTTERNKCKLSSLSKDLLEAKDSISNDSRSQEARVKCLEEELRKTTERNKLKISSLSEEFSSMSQYCNVHDEQIMSLEKDRTTQAQGFPKLEKAVAMVETRLAAIEEKVANEISDWRLSRQSQDLAALAGNSAQYDKLKARIRKLEGQLHTLQQNSSTEERKHRLLEGNTKYTRQLNESVNVWKAQCDKEQSEAKLLKEQMQELEKHSSQMEKMLRDQQKLIEELSTQLTRQRETSRVSETPLKEFWQS